jgi:hypothetical protein
MVSSRVVNFYTVLCSGREELKFSKFQISLPYTVLKMYFELERNAELLGIQYGEMMYVTIIL